MDRQDRVVIAAGAFALVFLIAGYLKENDMRILLTFIDQQGQRQQVATEWPTFEEAVAWARKFLGASTVIATSI